MAAKRDSEGRLLCKRPGCNNVRYGDRLCREHHEAEYAAWLDAITRPERWRAPWRDLPK